MKNYESTKPLTCLELLQKFSKQKTVLPMGKILNFSGIAGNDVYNICPFLIDNQIVIAGRVEARNSWAESKIMFFKEKNNIWDPIYQAPIFDLEDSSIIKIGNEIILSGVETYKRINNFGQMAVDYQTVFYRGHDLMSLKKFAASPDGMKDVRIIPRNGRISVFTRPQGGNNGRGKIGYTELDKITDIGSNNLLKAKIIENQFAEQEWGGANDLSLLANGNILVYGHIAYEDPDNTKHYYVSSFIYDPENHLASPIKIILTRENFPKSAAKTVKHRDIIFLGGKICQPDRSITFYVGLSDAAAGCYKFI